LPNIEQAKKWYPIDDPVHGFDHVLRVYRMAERLALAEGADLEIVRAAVLLHDAQPPRESMGEMVKGGEESGEGALRSNHHLTSAAFAGQVLRGEGWADERIAMVQHCIRAHRFRDDSEQPQTLEAMILFDADKLDAIGAIGAARAVAYAARASQPAYVEPSAQFLASGTGQPGEAHSAYHEHLFKLRRLKERLYTSSGRALGEARHRYLVDFFEQLAAESRGER
jgi:uncharacterized protein